MGFFTNSSPYASTRIIDDQYLDTLTIRPIPAQPDDVLYTIESQYNHRPDLLAYDLYGNEKLWWVFGSCCLISICYRYPLTSLIYHQSSHIRYVLTPS